MIPILSNSTAANLFYKVISDRVAPTYRTSTPTLWMMTNDKRGATQKGQKAGTKGFFDRFENATMYLTISTQAARAAATQPGNQFSFSSINLNQYALPVRTVFASVRYAGLVEDSTASPLGSIEKFTKQVSADLTNGMKLELSRMLWGNVGTGNGANPLATTQALGSATKTIPIQSLDAAGDGSRYSTMYMALNQAIQINGATGGTSIPNNVSATTITGMTVNTTPATITVADALTFAADEAITVVGNDGNPTYEIQGIQAIMQNATNVVQGVDLSTMTYGFPHVYPSTGTFTISEYSKGLNECMLAKPSVEVCNRFVYNTIAQTLISNERTGMGPSSFLDAGYKGFTSHQNSMEVILDYDCPGNSLYGFYPDAWTLAVLNDVQMIPMGMMRVVGYDVFEFAVKWRGQAGCGLIEPNYVYSGITTV